MEGMVSLESKADGRSLGFWGMTQRLRQAFGVNVTRDAVSTAQRSLDPSGVANRSKRRLTRREYEVAGPNDL